MKTNYLEQCLSQLDGMIATFQQAVVIGGRSRKESEACELLKQARLKIVEELEQRGEGEWRLE